MGVVVLKRLEDALADRDPIDAVIKGTAISNDGSRKISYVAPSADGQARAIAGALALSGVEPETVTAIEAHGTSTAMGDPIEIEALTRAYGTSGRTGYCALGSVKGNIGHLDSASGISGLIKAILQVKYGELVPTLNHTEPNPEIDFSRTPFVVNTSLRPWETGGLPRRIGVSSFGVGGTNAHVILEQAPEPQPSTPGRPVQLLPVSAATSAALDEATARLATWLRTADGTGLADVAYTLQAGREALRHRRVAVADDPQAAAGLLERLGPPKRVATGVAGVRPKVAFMFTGQGGQYPGMGRDLYASEPSFAEHLDTCAELAAPELGLDLREVLWPDDGRAEESRERLADTAIAQPVLFALEYALARLWQGWGVSPDAMIGHSLGEITAAAVAGVLTLEDAMRLVVVRGQLMRSTAPGAMLSVPLPETRTRELLPETLSLAAVNAADSCVVSGPREAVERFAGELAGQDVEGRFLSAERAFHSALMDGVLAPFEAELERLSLAAPSIPFVSNRTGNWIRSEEATDPAYWRAHVREPVRFGDGVRLLLDGEEPVALLEIGPGRTLASLAKLAPGGANATILTSLPHARDTQPSSEFLPMTAGRLWIAGVELDWKALHAGERRRRLRLPTYPFQRQSYWVEPARGREAPARRPDVPEDEAPEPGTGRRAPRPDLPTEYVAPRDVWEERIAAIWEELLGIEAMGVHDDFHEMGAESLISMRVRERIKEDHGVSVPLRRLLGTTTIAELAKLTGDVESDVQGVSDESRS